MSEFAKAWIKSKINQGIKNIPNMSETEIREELRKIRLQESTAEAVNKARIRIAKYHDKPKKGTTGAYEMIHPFDIHVD